MLVNSTLLIPLLLVATRPDPHRVIEKLRLAESAWLPTPLGQTISLSPVTHPTYRGLSDFDLAAKLSRNWEEDLDAGGRHEDAVPFTGGFLVLDDDHIIDGYVKAIGFDDGWDAFSRSPLDEASKDGAAIPSEFTGAGWTQEVHHNHLGEIPSIFGLDDGIPAAEPVRAPPQVPVARIQEKVTPRCLHWYITSKGEKIGEFEPKQLGSVIWEDAKGKEVLLAYLGITCSREEEVDEQPLLWREGRPDTGKVVINKKPKLSS